MQLKKNNNTLKKILCSDDKNTQRVHNKCCTGRKSHLWCHFIILILTRTGLHRLGNSSSMFCPHFLWGSRVLISIPRKIGSPFLDVWHSRNMSNNTSWLVRVAWETKGEPGRKYDFNIWLHKRLRCVNSLSQLCKFGYGFTNFITQPTWRSILFCVYEPVHWSKNIAVLSYILPSLFKRASKNEWQTWRDHMPGMSQKVSGSRERLS